MWFGVEFLGLLARLGRISAAALLLDLASPTSPDDIKGQASAAPKFSRSSWTIPASRSPYWSAARTVVLRRFWRATCIERDYTSAQRAIQRMQLLGYGSGHHAVGETHRAFPVLRSVRDDRFQRVGGTGATAASVVPVQFIDRAARARLALGDAEAFAGGPSVLVLVHCESADECPPRASFGHQCRSH